MAIPLPLKLNDANMLKLVRDIAKNTANVAIEPHAKKRMKERKITLAQVYDCLRMGVVSEPAHLNIRGNWQCTVQRRNAGDEVRVAVVIEKDDAGDWIAVVTVF